MYLLNMDSFRIFIWNVILRSSASFCRIFNMLLKICGFFFFINYTTPCARVKYLVPIRYSTKPMNDGAFCRLKLYSETRGTWFDVFLFWWVSSGGSFVSTHTDFRGLYRTSVLSSCHGRWWGFMPTRSHPLTWPLITQLVYL